MKSKCTICCKPSTCLYKSKPYCQLCGGGIKIIHKVMNKLEKIFGENNVEIKIKEKQK